VSTTGDSLQVATFHLEDSEFGIDIMRCMEILRPQKVTLVPDSPPYVDGVFILRGQVIPCVSLRGDRVERRLHLEPRDVTPSPRLTLTVHRRYLHGVTHVEGRVILRLDLDDSFSEEEQPRLAAVAPAGGEA
jgi:purine-binding chemotaxis protein CheW